MNLSSPFSTALLRGAYTAFGTGGMTFLVTYAAVDDLRGAIVAGGIAALGALGFRAGEGAADQRRQNRGDVKASDVGQ